MRNNDREIDMGNAASELSLQDAICVVLLFGMGNDSRAGMTDAERAILDRARNLVRLNGEPAAIIKKWH